MIYTENINDLAKISDSILNDLILLREDFDYLGLPTKQLDRMINKQKNIIEKHKSLNSLLLQLQIKKTFKGSTEKETQHILKTVDSLIPVYFNNNGGRYIVLNNIREHSELSADLFETYAKGKMTIVEGITSIEYQTYNLDEWKDFLATYGVHV